MTTDENDARQLPTFATDPLPRYDSLTGFVGGLIEPVYVADRLGRGSFRWCWSWELHPEAVARLDALWRAYEYLSLDDYPNLADWWRAVDEHLDVLTDPHGTFAACKDGAQAQTEPEHSRHYRAEWRAVQAEFDVNLGRPHLNADAQVFE